MPEIETYHFAEDGPTAQRVTRNSDDVEIGTVERRRTFHGMMWAATGPTPSTGVQRATSHKTKDEAALFLDALDWARKDEYPPGKIVAYQTAEGILREVTVVLYHSDDYIEIAESPGRITLNAIVWVGVKMATRIGGPGGLPVARER